MIDYGQAQKAAREWWRAERRREEGHEERTGPFTVASAIAEYLTSLEHRGREICLSRAAGRRDAHSARTRLAASRQAQSQAHRGLAPWTCREAPLARSKPGRKPNLRKSDGSADGIRRRRVTANRIFTVLKAALNHAWKAGHVASDDPWRRVKPFKGVETARVRYLSEDECVRLVNACAPDFRNLVRGALLTGCRYSELASATCGGFQPGRWHRHCSREQGGEASACRAHRAKANNFFSLTAGKLAAGPIFSRPDGE